MVTATATGDNNTSKSFVYSLNTALTPPTTLPKLRSASITLSARQLKNNSLVTVGGIVAVKDQADIAVSGATASVTWTLPNGTTQNQTVNTDVAGKATFNVRGGRGTYVLRVNRLTRPGYIFDSTNSVLSQRITVVTSASSTSASSGGATVQN